MAAAAAALDHAPQPAQVQPQNRSQVSRPSPPQPQAVNLNVSSSEAVPIDNGSDESDHDDEGVSMFDGHAHLMPPSTPADNCLISSSTGVQPPTPMDIHSDNNDLSVPSPNPVFNRSRSSRNVVDDIDDMIDSTVDSSSGYSSIQQNSNHRSNNIDYGSNEGPVQSSHYEDSSDDENDCDLTSNHRRRPGLSRQNSGVSGGNASAADSGISTSGQVDDGHFRLVPNNIEDERYNQMHPPRANQLPMNNVSSSNNLGSSPSQQPIMNQNNLFCEPGPSNRRNNYVNGRGASISGPQPNLADYELDALDNFPGVNDPSSVSGEFDPSNSGSNPVALEDIQVQNLEQVDQSSSSTSNSR